eukprot:3379019-Pleurochrysis_carterae.AAC.2
MRSATRDAKGIDPNLRGSGALNAAVSSTGRYAWSSCDWKSATSSGPVACFRRSTGGVPYACKDSCAAQKSVLVLRSSISLPPGPAIAQRALDTASCEVEAKLVTV